MRTIPTDPHTLAATLAEIPAEEDDDVATPLFVPRSYLHTTTRAVTVGWRTHLVDVPTYSRRKFHPECVAACCAEGISNIRPSI